MLQGLLSKANIELSEERCLLLERFVDELLVWTKRRNLTAITERAEVLEKHLVDSLTMLPFACNASRLLDIGSGAGFPGLPLKIACPELAVVSVDAVGKKVDFQRHAARKLGLSGFVGVHARIQDLLGETGYEAGFDLITARALTSLDELATMAEPFLAPGGRLVAMKGPEGEKEFSLCREQLSVAGWRAVLHRRVLPVSGAHRCLIELSRD